MFSERSMVRVSLAYEMLTQSRTHRDEYADLVGEVQEVSGDDALVFFPACFAPDHTSREAWINVSRLSPAAERMPRYA